MFARSQCCRGAQSKTSGWSSSKNTGNTAVFQHNLLFSAFESSQNTARAHVKGRGFGNTAKNSTYASPLQVDKVRVVYIWIQKPTAAETCVGWGHLGGGAYHVLGGITWAGVLTMCWVGSLGRGCLPCVGWDHLGGGAYHVLGGIKQKHDVILSGNPPSGGYSDMILHYTALYDIIVLYCSICLLYYTTQYL